MSASKYRLSFQSPEYKTPMWIMDRTTASFNDSEALVFNSYRVASDFKIRWGLWCFELELVNDKSNDTLTLST